MFVSHTRLTRYRTLPRAIGRWALDSGAFPGGTIRPMAECGTIKITDADDRGVPTRATCPACGWTWEVPPGDEWADTLPTAARDHRASTG